MALQAQSIERVVVGESSDADKLNPYTNFSATGSYINEYLYSSLLRTDKGSGHYLPMLATDLPEISEDQLTFTYAIHPLARFNNGDKITAEDVAFSLKAVRNPWVNNSQKRVHYEAITQVQVIDENTVRFHVARPSSQALRITSDFAILSRAYFDPSNTLSSITLADLSHGTKVPSQKAQVLRAVAERLNVFGTSGTSWEAAPTCGTYVLTEWTRGVSINLEANKHFWGRKLDAPLNIYFAQNVAQIEFQIETNEQQLRRGIFEGRYDLVASMPPSLYSNLIHIPALVEKYKFVAPNGPSYEYVGLNMKAGSRGRNRGMEDLAVRQALSQLVHVDLLMVLHAYGLGSRMASDFPAQHPGYQNTDLPLIEFDPDAANSALDKAGWLDSDGNGLRDRVVDGEEVQLVLECIYNDNSNLRKAIAEHIAENAMKAGILVVPVPLPWKEYMARLNKGDFEISLGAWVADPNEDSYRQIWHSKSWGSGSNFVGFGDEETDHQIELYDETIDPNLHKAMSLEIQQKIYSQQPYIFLWRNDLCTMVSKRYEKMPIFSFRPGFWIPAWGLGTETFQN
ncbi:MAG: ABC transporter substrate-binding protein [Bacteroidia bacterium]